MSATGAVAWRTVDPLVHTATPVPSPRSAIEYVPAAAPPALTSPLCGRVGPVGDADDDADGSGAGAAGNPATSVAANAAASSGVSHWPERTVTVPEPPSVYVSV